MNRGAYELARRHRDELLPLARRVSQEQLLRYNGMLIGVFELLADAGQVAAAAAAQDALRDLWLAEVDLDQALSAGPPPAARGATDAAPTPPPAPLRPTEHRGFHAAQSSFLIGAASLAAASAVSRAAMAALPEPVIQTSADSRRCCRPMAGPTTRWSR
jgi:hypothetical protein